MERILKGYAILVENNRVSELKIRPIVLWDASGWRRAEQTRFLDVVDLVSIGGCRLASPRTPTHGGIVSRRPPYIDQFEGSQIGEKFRGWRMKDLNLELVVDASRAWRGALNAPTTAAARH